MTDLRTHPEYLALLAAVRELPGDDLPRLVLADWLDERGEDERAAFIRAQVELAKLEVQPCSVASGAWIGPLKSGLGYVAEWPNSPPARCAMPLDDFGGGLCRKCARFAPLAKRERELLAGPKPHIYENEVVWFHPGNGTSTWRDLFRPTWRRGFVDQVTCPLGYWFGEPPHLANAFRDGEGQGPLIVRRYPTVERVEVTDREPAPNQFGGPRHAWTFGIHGAQPSDLPYGLIRQMYLLDGAEPEGRSWYSCPTRAAALDALSAALIAWAKASR